MTKKRNYEKEILVYLEEHKVNGLVLRDKLRMQPGKLCNALVSLQSAGKIRFIQNPKGITRLPGRWLLGIGIRVKIGIGDN